MTSTASGHALVVDLQANLLDSLGTRVVAPLLPTHTFSKPISRVNPQLTIAGEAHVVATHLMGAILVSEIAKTIANLHSHYDEVAAATDFLFNGFQPAQIATITPRLPGPP